MENAPNLRKRRKELHLTLKNVADYVGVSESTVSRWETGNISSMRQHHIILLAEILKTSKLWILGDDLSNSLHEVLDLIGEKAIEYDKLVQELHSEFYDLKVDMSNLCKIVLALKRINPKKYGELLNFLNYLEKEAQSEESSK